MEQLTIIQKIAVWILPVVFAITVHETAHGWVAKKYGDIFHVKIRSRHHFYIRHPDHIEKILLAGYTIRTSKPRPLRYTLGTGLITSEGELHSVMRRHIQPLFQKNMLADKPDLINERVGNVVNKWKEGQTREITHEMMEITLGVILRVLFSTAFNDEETIEKIRKNAHLVHLHSHQDPASHINMHIESWPWVGKWTGPARARRFLDELIFDQIHKRRAQKDFSAPDLLSSLLKIQESQAEGGPMNDRQIKDELLTVFLAGHETTTAALSWTWYLLSQNPEAEKKLHEEVDRVLDGRLPTGEDLPKLSYTRMVFLESMRLYPPVWTLGRRPASEDFWLDGYQIPKKSVILISPYLVHHDERFFPDPERFIPERFTPEEEAKRPRFAYFPFAGGNRKCIGEPLTMMEGIITLSTIASRWRLRLVPGHPIRMAPRVSLQPKYGIRMILERRSH